MLDLFSLFTKSYFLIFRFLFTFQISVQYLAFKLRRKLDKTVFLYFRCLSTFTSPLHSFTAYPRLASCWAPLWLFARISPGSSPWLNAYLISSRIIFLLVNNYNKVIAFGTQ